MLDINHLEQMEGLLSNNYYYYYYCEKPLYYSLVQTVNLNSSIAPSIFLLIDYL